MRVNTENIHAYQKRGSARIRTEVNGSRVQGANHYTTPPSNHLVITRSIFNFLE